MAKTGKKQTKIKCFYLIFQRDKNNCLCTYRNNNYVDNYLKGIKLFLLKDYQICYHDAYSLKVKRNIGLLKRVCA